MTNVQAPKKSVYRYCRRIFSGSYARIRKTKKVRRLLEKNQHVFRPLTRRYDLQTICNTAKELLDAGVFDSQSKAEAQFPDLFAPSDDACREESEPSDFETTKSEAEAMEMVALSGKSIEAPYISHSACTSYGQDPRAMPLPSTGFTTSTTSVILATHSLSLRYKTQHRLLTTIQLILEECCFDFGRRWLPNVLKARSCDCVESLELTQCSKILCKHYKGLPSLATTEMLGVSFRDVILATDQIRHSAVHRRSVDTPALIRMLESAALFTAILKDGLRSRKIEAIGRELQSKINELQRVQEELEIRVAGELATIARRRALLDSVEDKALDHALHEGNQLQWRLGSELDAYLMKGQDCNDTDLDNHGETNHPEDPNLKLEQLEGL